MATNGYRPEIDGLRALAVIPVVLFHLGLGWMPGGFVGVDVFFVISGFLITGIIVDDVAAGSFKFARFWSRRIRRIVPPLVVMVALVSLAGYLLLYAPDAQEIGRQGGAALLSLANVYFFRTTGDYWGTRAEDSPLLHTWSLSVEEQFYLFFPVVIVAGTALLKRRVGVLLAVIVAASFGLFLYGCRTQPSATFYLLPTRAWELGAGCLLAIWMRGDGRRAVPGAGGAALRWLPTVGALAIVASVLLVDGEPGISPLLIVPVMGTVLILLVPVGDHAAKAAGPAAWLLGRPPVVYVGKISYSLYLWHWPVFVFAARLSAGYIDRAIASLLALPLVCALAVASYHLVEQRTRRREGIVLFIVAGVAMALGFTVYLGFVMPDEDTHRYNETTWYAQLYDVAPRRSDAVATQRRLEGINVPKPRGRSGAEFATGGIIKLYGAETPEVVVIGDSHALMWSKIIDEILSDEKRSVSFYAMDGTNPFFAIPVVRAPAGAMLSADERERFDHQRLHYLESWRPQLVIIAARWSQLSTGDDAASLLSFVGKLGARVILLEDPPELFFGDQNAPQYLAHLDMQPERGVRRYIAPTKSAGYQAGRRLVRGLAAGCKHCELVEIADLFTAADGVWVLDDKDVLYVDDDHLSYEGALRAKPRLQKALRALLR